MRLETNAVTEGDLERPLPIRLMDDAIEGHFSNLLHVNFDRTVFQVTFSQILFPTITAPDEARALNTQGYVPAKVLARLIFTPKMVEETIQLLQKQLDSFRSQNEEQVTGEEQRGPE